MVEQKLITEALCDPGVRESEVSDLQDQLATVAASVIHTAGSILRSYEEVSFRLFWVLNHLLSSSSEAAPAYETVRTSYDDINFFHLSESQWCGITMCTIRPSKLLQILQQIDSNPSKYTNLPLADFILWLLISFLAWAHHRSCISISWASCLRRYLSQVTPQRAGPRTVPAECCLILFAVEVARYANIFLQLGHIRADQDS